MDKPQVFICSDCGKPIHEDDIYLDILNEQFCKECFPKHITYAKKIEETKN